MDQVEGVALQEPNDVHLQLKRDREGRRGYFVPILLVAGMVKVTLPACQHNSSIERYLPQSLWREN